LVLKEAGKAGENHDMQRKIPITARHIK